jgi:hypothetical protein
MAQQISVGRSRVLFNALFGAALAACAGQDTPPIDDDFAIGLRDCATRTGTCAPRPSGGMTAVSPASSSGSRNNPPQTAGDGGAEPPAGGSTSIADAGSSSSGTVCDGFAVLKGSCGASSFCHGAGSMVSAFADTPSAAASFVGERAEGDECAGETSPLFDPEDPAGSLVITKLGADPPCGSPMPLGGSLEPDDIACVQEWIESL